MAYISEPDLLKEFSAEELARLTGDPSGASVNHDKVETAIVRAAAIIDTTLHGKYSVPFSQAPEIIAKIASDLCVAHLYEFNCRDSSLPATIAWRKVNAMSLLNKIASGQIVIAGYVAGTNAPPAIACKTKQTRLFPDDVLSNYSGE